MNTRHLLSLGAGLIATGVLGANVPLQEPTATFSQTLSGDFTIANTLQPQGPFNLGWAIYDGPFGPPYFPFATGQQTAAYETVADVGFTNETTLTFTLSQLLGSAPYHTIGRLRLSATTDPRSTFADGLRSGGNVGTNWIVLEPVAFGTASSGPVSKLSDNSLLYGGPVPPTDVYFIRAYTSLTNITGFRLEVLTDPSLPGDGPGRQPENGNFVLTGFEVDAQPGRVSGPFTRIPVSLGNVTVAATENVTVPVNLGASGLENSVAFSVAFDTNRLVFLSAQPGAALTNLSVTLSTNDLPLGRIGITAAVPAGETLPQGPQGLLGLEFASRLSVRDASTSLTFTDSPVAQSIQGTNGSAFLGDWSGSQVFIQGTVQPIRFQMAAVEAKAGTIADIPVTVRSYGIENALSFSVAFPSFFTFLGVTYGNVDPALQFVINTNQLAGGRIGIAAALPTGAVLPRGTNELIRIHLGIPADAVPTQYTIPFRTSPTAIRAVDIFAADVESIWLPGTLRVLETDFEADVQPKPNTNRRLDIADWVQIGRYVAGLDTAADGNEFQRADCAPLATAGNGFLTVSDWVQAGRFAGGVDPLVPAGGPSTQGTNGPNRRLPAPAGDTSRILAVRASDFVRGRTNELSVHLDSLGDENALAFSLAFNPAELSFVDATPGDGVKSASVNLNANRASQGRIGVAIALPTGARFSPGSAQVLRVRFVPVTSSPTKVDFTDGPVFREVSSPAAVPLAVNWSGATMAPARPTLSVNLETGAEPAFLLAWPESFDNAILRTSSLFTGGTWQDVGLTPVRTDGRFQVRVPATAGEAFFRLEQP